MEGDPKERKFLAKKSICESSLILNSSSVSKATVNDPMNTRGVIIFPVFQPSFIGERNLLQNVQGQKIRSLPPTLANWKKVIGSC